MAKPEEGHSHITVESFRAPQTSGLHGEIHIRPVAGQGLPTTLRVERSKVLSRDYPVGTKFRIWAKVTDREGEGEFLYSHFRWKFEIVSRPG